jgi:peroxiredoxin family protein
VIDSQPAASFSVYLLSSSRERILSAVNLAATALALGRKVQLFLAWDALAAYCNGGLGSAAWPASLAAQAQEPAGQPDLDALLQELRAGGLKLYACSSSLHSLQLDEHALAGRVDGISGTTGLLAMAGDGPILSF